MKKLALSLVLLGLAPTAALAADPTIAGSAQIGTHPTYGSGYAGFWRTGAPDYTLLTDGTATFLNAPSLNGAIYFRGQNNTWMTLNQSGLTNNNQLLQIGTLTAESASTFNSSTTLNGNTLFNQGFIAHQSNVNNWAAYVSGSRFGTFSSGTDYGIYAEGNTYAVYSIGPMYVSGASELQGNVTLDNLAYKPGGGPFLASSDRRVKKDIVDFKLGLAAIAQLHPVRYKYNGLGGTVDNGQEYVGVIAQDLEKVAPFMVSSQKKKLHKADKQPTEIKHVDPNAFTYMLVNAVQELESQNKELRRMVCQDHPTDRACQQSGSIAITSVFAAKLASADK